MKKTILAIVAALGLTLSSNWAQPASSTSVSFQGALNGANGQPLPNGNYNLTFKFYDVAAGGTALASANVASVTITGGIASTPIPVNASWFNGQTRYLGISANGGAELAPRLLTTAVPYAIGGGTNFHAPSMRIDDTVHIGPDHYAWDVSQGWPFRTAFSANRHAGVVNNWLGVPVNSFFTPLLSTGNSGAGFGVVEDDNVVSPIIWMYQYYGRNAFQVRSVQLGQSPMAGSPLFTVRANGYVGVATENPQSELDVNGTARMTVCQITSDRNAKQDFISADGDGVLAKLAELPISTWSYTNAPGIRHLGPMAQDFYVAFGIGEDDKHIATVDADGVALAAIQGLNRKLEAELAERDARGAALEREVARLRDSLESCLAPLEKAGGLNATVKKDVHSAATTPSRD